MIFQETISCQRLTFLLSVDACHGDLVGIKDLVEEATCAELSDCLIEGSKMDQISHFMLR